MKSQCWNYLYTLLFLRSSQCFLMNKWKVSLVLKLLSLFILFSLIFILILSSSDCLKRRCWKNVIKLKKFCTWWKVGWEWCVKGEYCGNWRNTRRRTRALFMTDYVGMGSETRMLQQPGVSSYICALYTPTTCILRKITD